MNPVTKQKTYFKGLNGIRAVAAIGVLGGHVISPQNQLPRYAVIVFFTLSGFLITYLLLQEKARTRTINLKNFYIRRILRIWPLYFFYIFLVLFIHYGLIKDGVANIKYLGYFFVFFQNIPVCYLLKAPTDMTQLWSIGIEEQFYFFWPFVISYISNKKRFLFFLILAIIIIRTCSKIYAAQIGDERIFYLAESFRFDCMAIGALAAIYFFEHNTFLLRLGKSIFPFLAFWAFVLLAACYRFNFFSIYSDNVVSVIAAMFIINQIASIKETSLLENPLMNFFGKISYGIYIYHPLFISLFLLFLKSNNIPANPLLMLLLVFTATVATAFLSYNILEKPFLNIKKRYS